MIPTTRRSFDIATANMAGKRVENSPWILVDRFPPIPPINYSCNFPCKVFLVWYIYVQGHHCLLVNVDFIFTGLYITSQHGVG